MLIFFINFCFIDFFFQANPKLSSATKHKNCTRYLNNLRGRQINHQRTIMDVITRRDFSDRHFYLNINNILWVISFINRRCYLHCSQLALIAIQRYVVTNLPNQRRSILATQQIIPKTRFISPCRTNRTNQIYPTAVIKKTIKRKYIKSTKRLWKINQKASTSHLRLKKRILHIQIRILGKSLSILSKLGWFAQNTTHLSLQNKSCTNT